MSDIVAFLTARLDEDAQTWKTIWHFRVGDKSVDGWWDLGGTFGGAVNSIINTTRGGRDIAAKRGLLKLAGIDINGKPRDLPIGCDCEHCRILRLLAAPYADHPDYDPAWTIAA